MLIAPPDLCEKHVVLANQDVAKKGTKQPQL
jgi:hypothetical protein